VYLHPPDDVVNSGQRAVVAYLLRDYHEYKILILAIAGRRKRPRLPPELWELVLAMIR
jgi:hypothetical protein